MRNGIFLLTLALVCFCSVDRTSRADGLPEVSAVAHNCGQRGLLDFGTVYTQAGVAAGASNVLYSTVGNLDDASTDYLGSTARIWEVDSSCTISHSWRNRAHVETASEPEHPLLPSWAPYLASDVVHVAVSSGTYALQLNYSPSIESPGDEVVDAPSGQLFLGWLDTTTDTNDPQWANAANKLRDNARGGTDANGPYLGSWAEFRTSHTGSLSNYLGYWGVEIDNNNPLYDNSVWAVVNTSGTYAVVPEPGTLAILSVGILSQIAWTGLRRRRRLPRIQ